MDLDRMQNERQPANTLETRPKPRQSPRENCLMVFNVPETVDDNVVRRHQADITHLQNLINSLLNSEEAAVEVKAVTRIGPYAAEAVQAKPRPMKVIFTNPKDPIRLLKQGRKLSGQPISIRPDMDVETRMKMRAALAELRERTGNGETNLTIRNFRVVKRRQPRLMPQPLLLRALPS